MTNTTESSPPENRPLWARSCDQTFALSELAGGLSSPANRLAFLPRSSLGWLFVGFPALQLAEKTFALEPLFQDPQCLIDIIFTNENFQSGFLSRLIMPVPHRTLLQCGLASCSRSTCPHFVGVSRIWAFVRSCTIAPSHKAAVRVGFRVGEGLAQSPPGMAKSPPRSRPPELAAKGAV